MTKNAASIAADVVEVIPDNRVHAVSPEDVRERLLDITDTALFPYASMDGVSLGYENASTIAVNRGDALGDVFPSPVYLQHYDGGGTPKVSVVELGSKRYAFTGRAIDLGLCGAVTGNSTKDTSALIKARGHLDDYGGGAIMVGARTLALDEPVDLGSGNDRLLLGLNGIAPGLSVLNFHHTGGVGTIGYGLYFGADSDKTADTQASGNRSLRGGIAGVKLEGAAALTKSMYGARFRNCERIIFEHNEIHQLSGGALFGEDRPFSDPSHPGLTNDIIFARISHNKINSLPDGAGTYPGHDFIFNSGAVLYADHNIHNGSRAAGMACYWFAQPHANWDLAILEGTNTSEDHDYFALVEGRGVASLEIQGPIDADSVHIAFLLFQPSLSDCTMLKVGDISAEDTENRVADADHQSYGIVVAPSGGHRLDRAIIRGRLKQFGAHAVSLQHVDQAEVDVIVTDCGLHNDGAYSGLFADDVTNLRANVNVASTGDYAQSMKHAIELDPATCPQFELSAQVRGLTSTKFGLASALLTDDQRIPEFGDRFTIDMGIATDMSGSFSGPTGRPTGSPGLAADVKFPFPVRIVDLHTQTVGITGGTILAKVQTNPSLDGTTWVDSSLTLSVTAVGIHRTSDNVVVAANTPIRVRLEGTSITGAPDFSAMLLGVRAGH